MSVVDVHALNFCIRETVDVIAVLQLVVNSLLMLKLRQLQQCLWSDG